MSSHAGVNLGLTWGWNDGEAGWGAPTNSSLQRLDTLVLAGVLATTNTPPTSPAEGDRYIVGAAPTGAWAGKATNIAAFLDSTWQFFVPKLGWTVRDATLGRLDWNGTAWITVGTGIGDAPTDGASYARKSGGWSSLPSSYFSGAYADLTGKPTLFSGAYADLTGKPTIPAAQVNSDWTATSGVSAILNKPALFSGAYADLTGKPTILPDAPSDGTTYGRNNGAWVAVSSGGGGIPDAPNDGGLYGRGGLAWHSLAAVALTNEYTDLSGLPTLFSGAYADLTGKPTLFSGAYADLTGKPSLFSGVYADLTGKPTLPVTMVGSGTGHAGGLVPDPGGTAGTTRFLREDGTWAVPPSSGGGGGATMLASLTDVSVPSSNLNDVLSYDGISKWKAKRLRISAGNSPSGTWNPALTKTAAGVVVFSNGNRTVALTSSPAGYAGVLSAVPCSGKSYFEIVLTHTVGSGAIGAGPSNVNTSGSTGGADARPGYAQQGFGYQPSTGAMFANGSSVNVGILGTGVDGDVIGFAYDAIAGKVWMRKNTGLWNNGAITAQDPANGIGGITVTPPAGTILVPTAGIGTNLASMTINQGDVVAFAGTPPAGFLGASGAVAGVVPDDVLITSLQDGDVLTWNATDAKFENQPAASIRSVGGRNGFNDGQFDSWVQGVTTNLSSTLAYCSDVWQAQSSGGTATVTRQSHTVGENTANSPIPPTYFLRLAASSVTSCLFVGRMENVGRYAGQSVTISFVMRAAAAFTINTTMSFSQRFGTGGSAGVDTAVTLNWGITTAFKRFSVRIDVPSIAGKTVATDGSDLCEVILNLPAGSFTLDISQAQIEPCSPNASSDLTGNGGYPTTYDHQGYDAESAKVQRLFCEVISCPGAYSGAAGAGNPPNPCTIYTAGTTVVAGAFVRFPRPMRKTPLCKSTLTTCRVVAAGAAISGQTLALAGITPDGVGVGATLASPAASAGAGWIDTFGTVTADARL